MTYVAAANRYSSMRYRRSGRSGVLLPELSLGLWPNFGDNRPMDTQRAIVRYAFDHGVTHFDLANNYGPPYGSAETNFGRILRQDLAPYRDEVLSFLGEHLSRWQVPDDVVFIDEIPKTSVGKFSKRTLRERFADYRLPTTE